MVRFTRRGLLPLSLLTLLALTAGCTGSGVGDDAAGTGVRVDGNIGLEGYEQVLHRRIAREARRQPLGEHLDSPRTVEIEMELSSSGALRLAQISQSSGDPDLDRLILQAVVAGSPYPEPPHNITAGLEYDIELRFVPVTASR